MKESHFHQFQPEVNVRFRGQNQKTVVSPSQWERKTEVIYLRMIAGSSGGVLCSYIFGK